MDILINLKDKLAEDIDFVIEPAPFITFDINDICVKATINMVDRYITFLETKVEYTEELKETIVLTRGDNYIKIIIEADFDANKDIMIKNYRDFCMESNIDNQREIIDILRAVYESDISNVFHVIEVVKDKYSIHIKGNFIDMINTILRKILAAGVITHDVELADCFRLFTYTGIGKFIIGRVSEGYKQKYKRSYVAVLGDLVIMRTDHFDDKVWIMLSNDNIKCIGYIDRIVYKILDYYISKGLEFKYKKDIKGLCSGINKYGENKSNDYYKSNWVEVEKDLYVCLANTQFNVISYRSSRLLIHGKEGLNDPKNINSCIHYIYDHYNSSYEYAASKKIKMMRIIESYGLSVNQSILDNVKINILLGYNDKTHHWNVRTGGDSNDYKVPVSLPSFDEKMIRRGLREMLDSLAE